MSEIENLDDLNFFETPDLTDEEVNDLIERAQIILQEVLPVALENDELNEEDVAEYNRKLAEEKVYQGTVTPPMYVWDQIDEDAETLMTDYVEVFFAFMQDDQIEPMPGDKYFAVVLLPKDSSVSSNAAIAWMPTDYDVDEGFDEEE